MPNRGNHSTRALRGTTVASAFSCAIGFVWAAPSFGAAATVQTAVVSVERESCVIEIAEEVNTAGLTCPDGNSVYLDCDGSLGGNARIATLMLDVAEVAGSAELAEFDDPAATSSGGDLSVDSSLCRDCHFQARAEHLSGETAL